MYGQMTAGSWIYIGTQGILQGTYETFAAVAEKKFGGTLAGAITLTAGPGRHGRRPATGRHHERRGGDLRRVRPVASARRIDHGYPTCEASASRARRCAWPKRRRRPGGPVDRPAR